MADADKTQNTSFIANFIKEYNTGKFGDVGPDQKHVDLEVCSQEVLLELARIAEVAERWEDMCEIMKAFHTNKTDSDESLEIETRNMLSLAFKHVVGDRRQAWRSLEDNTPNTIMLRNHIEKELQDYCNEILDLLDKNLINQSSKDYWNSLYVEAENAVKEGNVQMPAELENNKKIDPTDFYIFRKWKQDVRNSSSVVYNADVTAAQINQLDKAYTFQFDKKTVDIDDNLEKILLGTRTQVEGLVFYMKMSGDYMRYLAEFMGDEEKKEIASTSADHYKMALNCAKARLPPTHPTRLGLSLNMSVCYFEILNNREEACTLAKEAFDKAIEQLDTLENNSYKDSTLIMQLLRDNLSIWQDTGVGDA